MMLTTVNGAELFPIGAGSWRDSELLYNSSKRVETLKAAMTKGLNVIDADTQEKQSEALIGGAISEQVREDLFLISKQSPHTSQQLNEELADTLSRLQTDYLDLYVLDNQNSAEFSELVQTLENLKDSGKIRFWGVANFDVAALRSLMAVPHGRSCAVNQISYNLLTAESEELINYMALNEIGLIAGSPIFNGQFRELNAAQEKVLEKVAFRHQASIPQLMLAWTIRHSDSMAIVKSANKAHIEEDLKSEQLHLTTADLALLNSVFGVNKQVPEMVAAS